MERDSTNIIATTHKLVGNALRAIRDEACDGLTVKKLLDHLHVSRSHLEAKFRKILDRTVHDEITRVRLKRVCQSLCAGDDTLATIARNSNRGRVRGRVKSRLTLYPAISTFHTLADRFEKTSVFGRVNTESGSEVGYPPHRSVTKSEGRRVKIVNRIGKFANLSETRLVLYWVLLSQALQPWPT